MSKTTDIRLKEIATRLRDLRDFSGLTQKELGDKFNLSSQSISGYENGDVVPDIMTLIQYARLFKISIEELLSDNFYKVEGNDVNITAAEYDIICIYREQPEYLQKIIRELLFHGEKYSRESESNVIATKADKSSAKKSSVKQKKNTKNGRRK